MVYLLTKTLALIAVGMIIWLPGWVLERRWQLAGDDRESLFLARWCLGTATWIVSLFTLATLGTFRLAPMVGLTTLWLGAAWLSHRSTRFSTVPSLKPTASLGTLFLGLAGCLAVLLPVFAIAIDPTVSWDAQSYHLTLPRLYLEHDGFRPVPLNVYSQWPHGVELLFGAAMAVDDYMLAKALHFGFGLLCLFAIWRLASSEPRRQGSDIVGFMAAALFALNGVVLFELKVAYVDLAHAFFLLAGAIFVAKAHEAQGGAEPGLRARCHAFLLCGVAAGLLASVKITGVVSSALLGLALLPVVLRTATSLGLTAALRLVFCFAAPVLLLWLPWLAKAYVDTGNPVYPFLWTVFGGDGWSATLGEQFRSWQMSIGMGRSLADYALLPFRLVLHGGRGYEHFDGEIGNFWLLAAPFAAVIAWRADSSTRERVAVALAGGYCLVWALTSQQMRFLIPALALLAWPAARGVGQLAGQLFASLTSGHRSLALWAARLMVVTATVATLASAHGKVAASGWQHLRIYASPGFDARASTPIPAVFKAVDALPKDARLLMLNTNQGFFSPRDYVADSFFEASQITDWLSSADSPRDVAKRLADADLSHVLLELRSRGTAYPPALLDLLRDGSLARPIYRDDNHMLFELAPWEDQP